MPQEVDVKKTAIVMETWQVDMLEKFIVENMLTPGAYFIVGTADVKNQMWRIAVWFGDEAYNAQTTMNETLAELITSNPFPGHRRRLRWRGCGSR
jgi:hypothetical protein